MKIIGPFTQIITLRQLPKKGPISDEQLEIVNDGGIRVDDAGNICEVGKFDHLQQAYSQTSVERIAYPAVLIPGFVDCHTHICFGGSRAQDYAMRVSGKTYLEIAKAGGGIWDSVTQTRQATEVTLVEHTINRSLRHARGGVTTIEVKSGYGLSIDAEVAMLCAIQRANSAIPVDLISTCLAAHMTPRDFQGNARAYLDHIIQELFPILKQDHLSNRIDIFVEESAFGIEDADYFLQQATLAGFQRTVHADQFTTGGSQLAVRHQALSADHLEASTEKEIHLFAKADTVAVVLPGASLGLGMPFAPARKLIDHGACVAIASDWNPGSAPMGDLLTQACILGAYEKLSLAETLAGMCFRGAHALGLSDRGQLELNQLADMQAYPCSDYREIFYHQGQLKPIQVWKKGVAI